ncbi:hypothetical protein HPB50_000663 [Hyalomma asiaticum]|uniref:Uncharacterized protein n=1 Tax=Hyalomma asiaticum TaxID=266040 RepID=A0ACB7T4R5_HYAAI|nr:hypothetical protein HPB50_000663 [Hyalomma asiaticum]
MIRRSKVHPAILIAMPFLATLLLMTSPPWGLLTGRGSGQVPAEFLRHRYWNYDPETQEPRDPRQSCSLPALHPFHPAVWPYLNPVTPVVCKVRQPWLTFVDAYGNLRFNASSRYSLANLHCSYKSVQRVTDNKITYSDAVPFTEDKVPLNDDVITVSCSNLLKWPVYSNIHAVVRRSRSTVRPGMTAMNRRTGRPRRDMRSGGTMNARSRPPLGRLKPWQMPNVLIFGLDSVSRLSMMRFLPKTYDYLVSRLNAVVFRGMNKVGDNTFPNLLALLTGRRVEDVVKPGQRDKIYDDVHILWKDFKEAGYETLFAEDFPAFALFNYLARGFTRPPTDYYLRPFWLAVYESFLLMSSSALCLGNTPKHMLQLDYLKRYFDGRNASKAEKPFFAFSYLVEISHDFSQQVGAADDDFVLFLDYLRSNGHLDNTFLFFLSDHGHRFDSIRSTFVGRIEERLPFFAIALPTDMDWLGYQDRGVESKSTMLSRLNASQIASNLVSNAGRLTTPFDTYATLRDIASFASGGSMTVKEHDSRYGVSLFGEVRRDRTCERAGIPAEYCSCGSEVPVELDSPVVLKAATALVEKVNDLLTSDELDEPFVTRSRCAKLSLRRVHDAQELFLVDNVKETFDGPRRLRVTVEVLPSAAMLEALMLINGEEDFDVFGDISRINKYGNQSDCIRHAVLRKYCYCMDEAPADRGTWTDYEEQTLPTVT